MASRRAITRRLGTVHGDNWQTIRIYPRHEGQGFDAEDVTNLIKHNFPDDAFVWVTAYGDIAADYENKSGRGHLTLLESTEVYDYQPGGYADTSLQSNIPARFDKIDFIDVNIWQGESEEE